MTSNGNLYLKNPHSVLAILDQRPKDILLIEISSQLAFDLQKGKEAQEGRDAWLKVIRSAQSKKIPVETIQQKKGAHKGFDTREALAGAWVRPPAAKSIQDLFQGAHPQDRRVWIALDQVQDPHNLGSLFRTAAFFGVAGVITTQERSAPLSATVLDVACGGVESVPFSIETNLVRALEKAKELGVWVLGTTEHGEASYLDIQKDRPWLIVLGNEEKGLRRLTLESCDQTCTILPLGQGVTSLNVATAGAVLISRLSSLA